MIGIIITGGPVGDKGTNGNHLMSHQGSKTVQGRSFHFKIDDTVTLIPETLQFSDHIRIREWQPEKAALRTIKPGGSGRYSCNRIRAEKIDQPA